MLHLQHAATLALVALGSAGLVGVPLYLQAVSLLEQGLHDRLEGVAELAAIALLTGESKGDAASALLATVREEADLDAVCLLERSGALVHIAAPSPRACDVAPEDHAVLASLEGADSSHTAVRHTSAGAPYLFAFAPLSRTVDGASIVAVRASAPYLERLDALRHLFVAAGVAGVLSVGLLGAWIAKRLVRPVERLVAATEQLGEGEMPEPQERAGTVELERLQDAFSGMSVLVRAREKALRALAGAVAHEVKNPAHALRLNLGLLRRELKSTSVELLVPRIDILEHLLEELDATVEAFLSFARDRAPRRELVNLRRLLQNAAAGAEITAPEMEVNVDPLLVGRAVANLVRNAMQVGSERVFVRAVCADVLLIEVEDRGPGFPEGLLATAFEPFVASQHDGTGLGLAIVASIARAHGGGARIRQSMPGSTIIEIRLPLT
jgi:signal transduction histidine kinase